MAVRTVSFSSGGNLYAAAHLGVLVPSPAVFRMARRVHFHHRAVDVVLETVAERGYALYLLHRLGRRVNDAVAYRGKAERVHHIHGFAVKSGDVAVSVLEIENEYIKVARGGHPAVKLTQGACRGVAEDWRRSFRPSPRSRG